MCHSSRLLFIYSILNMLYFNMKGELIMSRTTQLTLQLLEDTYGVCRLAPTQ